MKVFIVEEKGDALEIREVEAVALKFPRKPGMVRIKGTNKANDDRVAGQFYLTWKEAFASIMDQLERRERWLQDNEEKIVRERSRIGRLWQCLGRILSEHEGKPVLLEQHMDLDAMLDRVAEMGGENGPNP